MNKKLLFFFSMAALTLASCTSGDSPAEEYYILDTSALITDSQTSDPSTASPIRLDCKYNLSESLVTLNATNLEFNGHKYAFLFQDMKYTRLNYGNGSVVTFSDPGVKETNGSATSGRLDAKITTVFDISIITGQYLKVVRQPLVSLNIDDRYVVRTFNANAIYTGTTATWYIADNQRVEYTDANTVYMVSMDLAKKKASVLIQNGKFAEQMPAISLMKLEDLDIEYKHGGYIIKGADIVPQVAEGSSYTPNPSYTFNNFSLRTMSEDLTTVAIDFQVAGRFHGSFSGVAAW